MKKYFIEYAGKSKEVEATSYSIADDLIFFYRADNVIFALNKDIIESVSVSTEEVSYKDVDLSKLISDRFLTQIFIEDSTIANDDSYCIALDIILGIDNKFKLRGNYNKHFYPNLKDAMNKLVLDFICKSIKTQIKKQ